MTRTDAHAGDAAVGAFIRDAWKRDEWVKPFFKRYAGILALTLTLGLFAFLFAGALMFTSGYMISLAATLPLTVLALHLPSLFVRIFGVGKPILQYVERLASHDWVLRMTSELRRKLYAVIERGSSALRGGHRLGAALGLLSEDIGHIQDLYLRTILPMASAWLLYFAVIALLGLFTVPVACLMALMLGVAVFIVPLASVCMNGARLMREKAVKSQLYDDLSDNVLGVADWVYAGRGNDYISRYQAIQHEARAIERAIARHERRRDMMLQVLFGICATMLLVWASAAFAPDGSPTGLAGAVASFGNENAPAFAANWIAAFVLCFFPLIEAFSPVPNAALGLVTHGKSIANLNELPRSSDEGAAVGTASRPVPHGFDIAIEGLTFSYGEDERPVLEEMTLHIPEGQVVAVLGRSGSGKSTLAALLRGESDAYAGRVAVGGCETRLLRDGIERTVGVIQQNPHIFNQTLRENMLIGKSSATDEEIMHALESVGLEPLVEELGHGLDSIVDESGRNFSGGERHRIALARILLARPSIVILDEPFAGLDPATEQGLVDTIFDTLRGSTVILITHHLQGVAKTDRAIMLERGRIVMDGSPDELARTDRRYRRLLSFDQSA